jgi:hypothetical protein
MTYDMSSRRLAKHIAVEEVSSFEKRHILEEAMRPAVRIIFAPIMSRTRRDRNRGLYVHGTAQNRTVTIDPRSSEIGKTLLHEMIHLRHPDWSEEAVVSETRLRWGKMSWKEKARLLRLLGSARLEGEEP